MAHSPAPDQGTDTTRNVLYRRITVGFAKLQMLDATRAGALSTARAS